jgi:hypothetical protein
MVLQDIQPDLQFVVTSISKRGKWARMSTTLHSIMPNQKQIGLKTNQTKVVWHNLTTEGDGNQFADSYKRKS